MTEQIKTKEYLFEVVTTKTVKVILPDSYNKEKELESWERYFHPLENGVDSIAEYAAELLARDMGEYHNDGVGKMITNEYTEPDYEKFPFQVVAVEEDDCIEVSLIKAKDWE